MLFGLHILFVVAASAVFALLGLNLSAQFDEYYDAGLANIIALAFSALVGLAVLYARVPVERAWTRALIRKELRKEPYGYTDVTFIRDSFTITDHSGHKLSSKFVKPSKKTGWFNGIEQFAVFETNKVARAR